MQSMVFQVSAKTARLIGRENISDVDGAILELVKNGYDADAECVYIRFINPFNNIPKKLTLTDINLYFQDNMYFIHRYYNIENGLYVLKEDVGDLSDYELFLHSLDRIIVIDNGSGMGKEVLETAWMNIGTSNKEENIYSPVKKRIKTGAKGIGRFALDKLSLATQVLTKCSSEPIYSWKIDWTQFDHAKLLNQVEAELDASNDNFPDLVREYLQEDAELINEFLWNTGTIIVLSPVREFWDEKLYNKVNNNLKNINPMGSVDRFEVFVKNEKYPYLSYRTETEGISRESYDYKIDAVFDGNGRILFSVDRNEIDTKKKQIQISYSPTDVETYELQEFWNREAFKVENYRRNDFDGQKQFRFSLKEILEKPQGDLERYNNVGPFSVKLYYLKNQKSTVGIIKTFKSSIRRNLLKNFSGVKIYRDGFKVRPYGDVGQFYDWLNISERVQRSPAAASHESGSWRVSPNQLIGSASISRISNPKLKDNANREGMILNREYEDFIEILQGIIAKFEYDRQYVLREYAAWERVKTKAHSDRAQEVYEQVKKEEESKYKNGKQQYDYEEADEKKYSEQDLKDTILSLGKEKADKTSTEQLMMVLSAAGVMAQTFSHEIARIGTELGSRGQHLKVAIRRLLNNEPYNGDPDFNPYTLLGELDETDELLAEWVNLIMDSVKQQNFTMKKVELQCFLDHIICLWQPLLYKKYITIEPVVFKDNITLKLPEIDLHLIVNNFILNSAYYLEEATGERKISFAVFESDNKIYLEMMNNGPSLDERYLQNPDITLNARETSKTNGTGLGLWFAREATVRNAGELHVIPIKDGYKLQAAWLK